MRRAAPPRIHPIDCHCGDCGRFPVDLNRNARADRIARMVFAGIATGLLAAAAIDAAIGGPGLIAAFGF